MPGKGHYAYFSSLERTIKVALAAYLTVLICGLVVLSWGGDPVGRVAGNSLYGMVYFAAFVAFTAGAVYLVVNRIHWLGELHIWLDQRFFGFLEKSNDIIFQELLRVLETEDRSHVNGLKTEERYSLTQSIFSRLADNFHLFDTLMRSGIFRLWIWYWVVNYGTFTFTLLTIGCFSMMVGSDGSIGLKPFFTFCWTAALAHLAANVVMGNILTRRTRAVSESIVVSYRPQISLMLRESLAR